MRLKSEKQLARDLLFPKVRFAYLPKVNGKTGETFFLRKYLHVPYGVWFDDNARPGERQLYQFRVGGSSMDGEGGKYNVMDCYGLNDRSWFKVGYLPKGVNLVEMLQAKLDGKFFVVDKESGTNNNV